MIEQFMIAVLGVTAIWLSQDEDIKLKRWACVFGLASQPFWFYSAIVAGQWGIVVLCFFYAAAWWKGVNTYWIKRKELTNVS